MSKTNSSPKKLIKKNLNFYGNFQIPVGLCYSKVSMLLSSRAGWRHLRNGMSFLDLAALNVLKLSHSIPCKFGIQEAVTLQIVIFWSEFESTTSTWCNTYILSNNQSFLRKALGVSIPVTEPKFSAPEMSSKHHYLALFWLNFHGGTLYVAAQPSRDWWQLKKGQSMTEGFPSLQLPNLCLILLLQIASPHTSIYPMPHPGLPKGSSVSVASVFFNSFSTTTSRFKI